MNNPKTPKIVIGVGLAAVYAAGAAYFLRGEHDNVVSRNVPDAPIAQIATEPVPPSAIAPASTYTSTSADTSSSVAEHAPATIVAAVPVTSVTAKNHGAPSTRGDSAERFQGNDQAIASVATASAAATGGIDKSGATGEGAIIGNEPINPTGDELSSVQADGASADNDSQITDEAKQ